MKLKHFLSLILIFVFALTVGAGEPLEYQIVSAGSGTTGHYLVKVYVYSKKNRPDPELLKKCAVHGVLFKGFTSQESRVSQKPLAKSAIVEQQNAEFFDLFFQDGGAYSKYADIVTTNYEVVKVAKKQYRIGVTLSVSEAQLRSDLEKAGILRGLNSGF